MKKFIEMTSTADTTKKTTTVQPKCQFGNQLLLFKP